MDGKEYRAEVGVLYRRIFAGEAIKDQYGIVEETPTHIRGAVDIAAVQLCAVTDLLISKGILTDDEVRNAILSGLRGEVMRLENYLSDTLQKTVQIL